MEESRLTRPYLESLCTDELVKLADSFGIDIPSGLERVFIIEELLDLALDDDFAVPDDDLGERPEFIEAAVLPKQYNISYIEVMIRDPLWAFVFWEIRGHVKDLYEKAPDFTGYCLRVVPLNKGGVDRDNSFTVAVGVNDTAWYLGFPPAEGCYQVEICALREAEETVLGVSRSFKMPRLLEPPGLKTAISMDIQDVYNNSLACLSGAREFAVIRNIDRKSRAKGDCALH